MLKPGISFGTMFLVAALYYTFYRLAVFRKYLSHYRTGLLMNFFALLYVAIVCSMNGVEDIVVVKGLFLWLLFCTVVPFFITEALITKIKYMTFWEFIIELGFIASIISCIALFSRPFNDFLRNIQLELNTEGGVLDMQLDFRAFGFADLLTSAYGYIQGLIASLCLFLIDKQHKRYILYIVLLFISVVINARTGLFPIGLTIFYLSINSILNFKIGLLIKYIATSVLGVFLVIMVLMQFPDIIDFVQDFIDQLSLIFLEDEFENSAYSKMLIFPNTTTGLVFGEGHSIFGSETMDSSDIGYVNQIFIGGLVFVITLVIYELFIYSSILKMSKEKAFATIFFISILIFNYKGVNFYSFSVSYLRLWILYYYILVHNKINPQNRIRLT